MAVLFDNLIAIVVGTVLVMTLVVLQMRQRITTVDETIHHSIRGYVQEGMDTFGEDIANAMTTNTANAAGAPSVFQFRLERDAEDRTTLFAFPTRLEDPTAGNTLQPAQLFYRLSPATNPDATPDTVFVGGAWRPTFRLERAVLFTPATAGTLPTASDYAAITGNVLVDFQVGLVGYATTPTLAGPAPAGVHSVRVSMLGALDRVDQISSDQRNTREYNGVRIATTYRPPDL